MKGPQLPTCGKKPLDMLLVIPETSVRFPERPLLMRHYVLPNGLAGGGHPEETAVLPLADERITVRQSLRAGDIAAAKNRDSPYFLTHLIGMRDHIRSIARVHTCSYVLLSCARLGHRSALSLQALHCQPNLVVGTRTWGWGPERIPPACSHLRIVMTLVSSLGMILPSGPMKMNSGTPVTP